MKALFSILIILLTKQLIAQEKDSIQWVKEFDYEITTDLVWTIDPYNNIYLANQDLILKIDPKGKKLFEQSLKKYGQIAKIDARNPMKILIFSEQQQSIFYLDNTLSKQENDIDLGESFDLSYVTQVSASNQMDKIWTFDQDNSKITLLTDNKAQFIQLENTSGLIDMKNISQFFEQNDRLFVVDSLKGVFIFDIYGTLIQFLNEKSIKWVDVSQDYIYFLRGKNLEIINLSTQNKKTVKLPEQNIQQFMVNQNTIFLRGTTQIHKYSVEIF